MPLPIGYNTYCLRALRWRDAQLLDFAAERKLDAVFLQDSIDPGAMDPAHWKTVREHAARLDLHLETGGGGILPKTAEEYPRNIATMRKHIERAAAMGSPLCRFVLASSRAALPPGPAEKHLETAVKMLREVRSQAMDSRLKIAIEVHKDFQAWEFRQLIETAGKEFTGMYLDTGNPVYVFEDPMQTVEILAPYALTVHFRDSVVYEHRRGIAVQWVPLGEGVIDFKAIVAKVEQLCPQVRVYIKPITGRPPDVIPYLEADFWKMFPQARGADLARFLRLAKSGKPYEGHVVIEDIPGRVPPPEFVSAIQYQQREHMERSIAYAKQTLGLGVRWRA